MTPGEWILGRNTGVSSKTIWAVMTESDGADCHFDIPHDAQDFGRCYRLLQSFPDWRKRIQEVADQFPKWGLFVLNWDKMTDLYEQGDEWELNQFIADLIGQWSQPSLDDTP